LIAQLDDPTYDANNSSTTDSTVSLRWNNPNDVATDIEVTLRTLPFTGSGGQTVVETKSVPIGANTGETVVFSNNINPLQYYDSKAKLLATGFRLESDEVISTPTIQTTQATTQRPTITIDDRTINNIDFTFTNVDSSNVDIYWNTTGNPDQNDNVLSDVGTTAPNNTASASITNLQPDTGVTIYWRAKASGELISSQGSIATSTRIELDAPVFVTSNVTPTTLNVTWGNGNDVGATIETILQINASPVPDSVRTFFIDANDGESVTYTGLSDNTTYNVRAKFIEEGDNAESPDANSGPITTDKFPTTNPTVNITNDKQRFTNCNVVMGVR